MHQSGRGGKPSKLAGRKWECYGSWWWTWQSYFEYLKSLFTSEVNEPNNVVLEKVNFGGNCEYVWNSHSNIHNRIRKKVCLLETWRRLDLIGCTQYLIKGSGQCWKNEDLDLDQWSHLSFECRKTSEGWNDPYLSWFQRMRILVKLLNTIPSASLMWSINL